MANSNHFKGEFHENRVIFAGLVATSITGCGGSVEHEHFESAEFSGQRTRIHVRLHVEPSGSYRVVEGQPIHVHIHAGDGQSVCIEISTGQE